MEEKATSKTPVSEAFVGKLVVGVAARIVLVGRPNSSLPGMSTMVVFAPTRFAQKGQIDQTLTAAPKAIEKNV